MSENNEVSVKTHFQHYVNYGLFGYPERAEAFRLNLDTWFYHEGDNVGTMELGIGPITLETGVIEYLWQQLSLFRTAFSSLADCLLPAAVGFQQQQPFVGGTLRSARVDDAEAFKHDVLESLSAPTTTVAGVSAWLEGRVTVREHEVGLVERQLPYLGRIWFTTSLRGLAEEYPQKHRDAVWSASLELDYLSLFQRDNQALLTRVRDRWQYLRTMNPNLTWDEESSDPLIVTLAELPADAPRSNHELHERNAPGLRNAIARWEHATDHAFVWSVSLE